MKVSKFGAIIISVIFFINVMILISLVVARLFPGFSFSDNQIIRIVSLVIVFILTKIFYAYIYGNLDKEEGVDAVNYSSDDLNKKVSIAVVVGFLISVIALFVFMNSTALLGLDDVNNPLSFSDSNISFKYPGNWKKNYDTDAYFVLNGDGVVFDVFYNALRGRSLDEVSDGLISELNDSNTTLLFRNTITIDSKKAYDVGFKVDSGGYIYHYRLLIFVSNNNYYVYTFTAKNLENIGSSLDLIKNTTKIKN